MASPSTDATGSRSRTITGNGTDNQPNTSQPRSSRVYVMGTSPGVRVPMREVQLTPTRLPGGGGYPILGYVSRVTTAAQNFLTKESRFGSDGDERDSYYDGVNVNVNARMQNGLFVSLGTQTGRRVDDRCNVIENFNNVVFNVATPDAESFQRSESQVAAMLARAVALGQRNL